MKRTKCSVCLSVCRPISGLLVPNIYSEIRLLLFFQSSPVLIAPLRAAGRFLETIKTRDSWKRPVGQDSRTQFWETPFLARSHDRTRQDSGKRHSPPRRRRRRRRRSPIHIHRIILIRSLFISPSPCSFPPSRPMTSSRPWRQ